MVQKYTPIHEEGQSSGYRPLEIESQHIDDSSEDNQAWSETNNSEESYLIDIDFAIGQSEDITIGTLTTSDFSQFNDPLPLVHPVDVCFGTTTLQTEYCYFVSPERKR